MRTTTIALITVLNASAADAADNDTEPATGDKQAEIESSPSDGVAAPSPAADQPTPPAPTAAAPGARAVLRIAVYEFAADGVPPRTTALITNSVVNELRKLSGVSVVGMDEIRAMLDLEAQKQMIGCTDESCLADIAGALGVDCVVTGTVARLADEHIFGLKRIDQRKAETVASVSYRLEVATGEEFFAVIGPAIEQTFGEFSLRPGAKRGVSDEIALALNPPPIPRWGFVTAAGVTSAAGVATLSAAAAYGAFQFDYSATAERSRASLLDGRELVDKGGVVVASALVTAGLGALTIGLASATGVVALFTDWRGYQDGARSLRE